MTTPEIEAEIARLFYSEHWKVATIVAQLGTHPDVVRRVLGSASRMHPSRHRACGWSIRTALHRRDVGALTRYLHEAELRDRIQLQLNSGEGRHALLSDSTQ